MKDIAMRVDAGMQKLDSHSLTPDKWRNKIDLPSLDMESPKLDVLGQLFGDYYTGLDVLHLSGTAAEDYGFVAVAAEEVELTQEWVNRINDDITRKVKDGDRFRLGAIKYTVIGGMGYKDNQLYGLVSQVGNYVLVLESELLSNYVKIQDYSRFKPGMLLTDEKTGTNFFKVSEEGVTKVWNLKTGTSRHIDGWITLFGTLNELRSYSGAEVI